MYALPEKTKKGPPTNKNISVRNMTAQITNMSVNENMGFKSEYHVSFDFLFSMCCLSRFIDQLHCSQRRFFHWKDIPRGELHPCVEGKKQENKVKNRYTTIFPCMYYDLLNHFQIYAIFYENIVSRIMPFSRNCRWSLARCFKDCTYRWRGIYKRKFYRSKY